VRQIQVGRWHSGRIGACEHAVRGRDGRSLQVREEWDPDGVPVFSRPDPFPGARARSDGLSVGFPPRRPTMWALRLRAYLASAVVFALFFGLFYALLYLLLPSSALAPLPGLRGTPSFTWVSWFTIADLALVFAVVFAQYWFAPRIVGWSMHVRYVSREDEPRLHGIIGRLAQEAGIPYPKVGISEVPEPNAFAFGRWATDGRVCVTRPLLELLDDEEMTAVLAHEVSHLRHKDMIFMTLLQIVPLIAYVIARTLTRVRGGGKGAGQVVLVGLFAFLVYLITTLMVLYVSRLREVYADKGSIELTGGKAALASALLRITHSTATFPKETIKEVGGARPLLVADPYRATRDAASYPWAQVAPGDKLTEAGLQQYDREVKRIGWHLRAAEILSTHPVLEHRLKLLAEMPVGGELPLVRPAFRERAARPNYAYTIPTPKPAPSPERAPLS
jgi:heat shock protein HtpX